MSQPIELWARFRQYATGCDAVGLTLDVSRMRFPDGLFDRLRGPMRRAFDDIAPVLALIPDLAAWSGPEKRKVVQIVRAKAGPDETRYAHLLQNHPKLRAAIIGLGKTR